MKKLMEPLQNGVEMQYKTHENVKFAIAAIPCVCIDDFLMPLCLVQSVV